MRLDLGNAAPQLLEVNPLVGLGPVDLVRFGKLSQRSGQVGLLPTALCDGFLEFLFHAATSPISSTKTMMSRSGPCTPMVSTRSMSAVRLGPVIKAI